MGQGVGALNIYIYIYIYELIFCLFVVLQEVIFFCFAKHNAFSKWNKLFLST